ncbi:hypothetical protein [Geobacillus stearothermophilus]
MYDMLSEETKKTVGKEQFVDRYKKFTATSRCLTYPLPQSLFIQ